MNAIFLASLAVYTLTTFSVTSTSHAKELENGVYLVVHEESGVKAKRFDGSKVRIGDRVEGVISEIVATSANNENSSYYLTFQFDLKNNLNVPNHVVLLLDGICSPDMAATLDQEDQKKQTLRCSGIDKPFVQLAGMAMGAKIRVRQHPGHKVLTSWAPTKSIFRAGETVTLRLSITNVGEDAFTFMDGGQQRGARNNQFGFTAFAKSGVGKALTDTGDPINFGGLAAYRTLAPGEKFEREVNINDWFEFKKPDSYLITGTFMMNFIDPEGKVWPVWDDFATGQCIVNIGGK